MFRVLGHKTQQLAVPEVTLVLCAAAGELHVHAWQEGATEWLELAVALDAEAPLTVLYRGPFLTGGEDRLHCPHCTHRWYPRVPRPTRCPRCWRRWRPPEEHHAREQARAYAKLTRFLGLEDPSGIGRNCGDGPGRARGRGGVVPRFAFLPVQEFGRRAVSQKSDPQGALVKNPPPRPGARKALSLEYVLGS